MDGEEATAFLQSLLCKNLRVTTTDSRMFWGSFKCTDAESNIILQHTYEYRHPSPSSIAQAAAAVAPSSSTPSTSTSTSTDPSSSGSNTVKVDMTSRYLGLIVIPGQHIVKIEVEEFASQVKNNNKLKKQTATTTTTSPKSNEPQTASQSQESTTPSDSEQD